MRPFGEEVFFQKIDDGGRRQQIRPRHHPVPMIQHLMVRVDLENDLTGRLGSAKYAMTTIYETTFEVCSWAAAAVLCIRIPKCIVSGKCSNGTDKRTARLTNRVRWRE